ncbi:MAG: uroporphyrinogen-III C-methyltransferase [Omnitrophica bacterium]|nr:uroporphyrinogen-III C-methyltransferase [Candidatus Omnitrophota bacterium]
MKQNKVYLVGAGSCPSLITVKGLEILRQADVVIYDYLVDKGLLDDARDNAELICSDELGKKRHLNGFLNSQNKINALMIKKAKEGKRVVRLKNGDPAIFSRISQELDALAKNKIEFEVVPGVTAASAAACFAAIPLTDRRFSSSVVFVTGHEDRNKNKSNVNWKNIAGSGTIVMYMAVENISRIAHKLMKAGKPKYTPVIVSSRIGSVNQKTVKAKLNTIARAVKKEGIFPPSIFIIGKVADFEKRLDGLRKSKRVLFTGLSKERFFTEKTYFHLPLIKIVPLLDYREFDNHLKNIEAFNWIILTSRYGVKYFFKRLNAVGRDSRALKNIKIAAIGSSTKEHLEEFGIIADLVPKNESSKGLLERFAKINISGKKIFLPRSDLSDKGLTEGLKERGARVTASIAYRNIEPRDLPDLELCAFDEIMFTSPSGVRNFVKRYGNNLPKKVKISYIGDITLREVKRCHLLE